MSERKFLEWLSKSQEVPAVEALFCEQSWFSTLLKNRKDITMADVIREEIEKFKIDNMEKEQVVNGLLQHWNMATDNKAHEAEQSPPRQVSWLD
ncbi:MAG: hypothetical protein GY801_01030 [bacterium]|nr:hypothetical protein [bacterium]